MHGGQLSSNIQENSFNIILKINLYFCYIDRPDIGVKSFESQLQVNQEIYNLTSVQAYVGRDSLVEMRNFFTHISEINQ